MIALACRISLSAGTTACEGTKKMYLDRACCTNKNETAICGAPSIAEDINDIKEGLREIRSLIEQIPPHTSPCHMMGGWCMVRLQDGIEECHSKFPAANNDATFVHLNYKLHRGPAWVMEHTNTKLCQSPLQCCLPNPCNRVYDGVCRDSMSTAFNNATGNLTGKTWVSNYCPAGGTHTKCLVDNSNIR